MDTIRIDTGEVELDINGDPNRIIRFSPTDVLMAERFFAMYQDFPVRLEEYKTRAMALEKDKDADEKGVPKNFTERVGLYKEVFEYITGRIDYVFGEGTSTKVFDKAIYDLRMFSMFEQFINGITPYFEKARGEVMKPYLIKPQAKPNTADIIRQRKARKKS